MTTEIGPGDARIIDIVAPRASAAGVKVSTAVRRHRFLVIGVAIAGSLAAFLLCKLLTPLYASQVLILIDPRAQQRTATSIDPLSFLPPSEEMVRKNEIAIIRSRRLADAVLTRLKLDQEPEFNPRLRQDTVWTNLGKRGRDFLAGALAWAGWELPNTAKIANEHDQAIDIFLSRLVVTTTDASRVIDIRFYAQRAQQATEIANAVAQQFMQDKGDQDLKRAQLASDSLDVEISRLNDRIHNIEGKIDQMRSKHGSLPAADLRIIADRFTDLNRQLVTAAADRSTAEGRLEALKSAIAANRVDSLSGVLNSPLIQKLQEQLAVGSAKVTAMSAMSGDRYGQVIALRHTLDGLRGQIEAEVDKIAASYRSDLAVAQRRESALRGIIETTKRELALASASDVDVRPLEREADARKALMTQLVIRLNDTRAQMNRSGPDARVISDATVSRSPAFPPTLPIVAVVFIMSATAGTIVAGLMERRDRSIRSTTQIRQIAPVRIFGATPMIPHVGGQRLPDLMRQTPMFMENLRNVWLQIDHARQGRARTLLITSAVPGEGKTSTATALAQLLGLDGRRVVIVDADLRFPAIHRMFGLKQSPGLAEVIADGLPLHDAIQLHPSSGTSVIAAGTTKSSLAHVLGSSRLSDALAPLATQFDVVIIDTPPLIPVSDAALLALQVDMTLMVVRWGSTNAQTFAAALQRLQDLNVAVKGVIMTMVDQRTYLQNDYPDSDMFSHSIQEYYGR